ncbi:DUF3352 domain-containing protein [Nocardioides sp. AX2bis]|uniref:DUF3352 domain-containing protein n=1 Tax=Nocardioides sp. AX2bis TaxID=2653157 RepID=UPI00135C79DA|nr:DUF3352 domain-containing protein [Nocardioides sp. AX2bis]
MSSTPPPSDNPTPPHGETLEQGAGSPVAPTRSSGGRKKLAVLGVGGVAVLAIAGGGAWAAMSFFGTGDQAAQALPASTVGYLSVDLDPSGEQKLEALRTLEKFPAFTDEVDIDSEDDLRRVIGEEVLAENDCGLDYDDDVAPWIGERFAVAAVDLGEETPSPVVVMQVSDAGEAESALGSAIEECADGEGGLAVDGDWALLAEDDDTAEAVLAQTGEASLADDEDFTRWMEEAGDPGVISGYLAPEAGPLLAKLAEEGGAIPAEALGDPMSDPAADPSALAATPSVPPQLTEALADFEGAAMTVRFSDGAVEVETAVDGGASPAAAVLGNDQGASAMSSLPEDTVAAFGVGFQDGWFEELVAYADEVISDGGSTVSDQLEAAEEATGLTLPEDVETLFGDSATVSLGSGADLASVFASEDLSALPVAVKVQGEPDEIEQVLEKLRTAAGGEPAADAFLASDAEGDALVVGPNADYRADVVGDGGLGGSEVFEDVVPDADEAGVVFFVNFDGLDDVADELAGGDPMVTENLAPLAGLGVSAYADDEVSHTVVRLTTD